jgi:hypothetical protein
MKAGVALYEYIIRWQEEQLLYHVNNGRLLLLYWNAVSLYLIRWEEAQLL